MAIQRNAYKGKPLRPWLKLGLRDVHRTVEEFEWIADTGTPMQLLLGRELFKRFRVWKDQADYSNFGFVDTAWFHLVVPGSPGVILVRGYCASLAVEMAQRSHTDFVGVVGLPILRRGKYGGDADDFWFDHS